MFEKTKPCDPQLLLVLVIIALLTTSGACRNRTPATGPTGQAPQANQPAGPSPSKILADRTLHNPPPLNARGDDARRAVTAFLDWAGASLPEEHEDGRKVLAGARENEDIVKAFAAEITQAQRTDHSRALLALSLLGEMGSPSAEEFLRQFVNQPFPESGTKTEEGEIVEQTALATLQAKAIDGLAYLNSPSANEEVLRQVGRHPSIIVRSEAISAYLWNQKDKEAARRTLLQHVRKGEERYIDQVIREEGESAASFNSKLEAYLKAHPDVAPPAPDGQRQDYGRPNESPNAGAPPKH
jgi:hypothetical protein